MTFSRIVHPYFSKNPFRQPYSDKTSGRGIINNRTFWATSKHSLPSLQPQPVSSNIVLVLLLLQQFKKCLISSTNIIQTKSTTIPAAVAAAVAAARTTTK
jgi:hypothetical protein